ncbi:hypothetical protein EDC01DRAFT_636783 [Geopyxis carbonaria]|nr:hypothetical protein EDC01DRAFT_636783 [Geopyxis carbonaria]
MRPKLVIGIHFGSSHSSVAWSYEGRQYIQVINWSDYVRSLKYPSSPNSLHDVGTNIPSLVYYEGKNLAWGFEAKYNESPLAWFNVPPETTRGDSKTEGSFENKYLTEDEKVFQKNCPAGITAEDVASDYLQRLWTYTLRHIAEIMGAGWTDNYRPQISISIPSFWSTNGEKTMGRVIKNAGIYEYATVAYISKQEAIALSVVERLERLGNERKKMREVNSYKIETVQPLQLTEIIEGDGIYLILMSLGIFTHGTCDIAAIHSSHGMLDSYILFLLGQQKYDSLDEKQREKMLRKMETSVQKSFFEKTMKDEYRVDLWGALRQGNGQTSPKLGTPIGLVDHKTSCQILI